MDADPSDDTINEREQLLVWALETACVIEKRHRPIDATSGECSCGVCTRVRSFREQGLIPKEVDGG